MKRSELNYNKNSEDLFAIVADEHWSMFLDSGYPKIDKGRYDIIVARPVITLETYDGVTEITQNGKTITSSDDPFVLLKRYLGDKDQNLSGLPFCGGALGYFSYDLGRNIELITNTVDSDVQMPDMAIGIYDWAVIVDHHLRRTWLASFCRFKETESQWQELQSMFMDVPEYNAAKFRTTSDVVSNMSKADYANAFDRVKDYILEGDCYQVNLAQRFSVGFEGNTWDAYIRLRKLNAAPFAAYINLPKGVVLSSSPERFLRLIDRQVETKPIKGTKHRSVFAYEDKALAECLLESEKDRAENLMIDTISVRAANLVQLLYLNCLRWKPMPQSIIWLAQYQAG